MEEDWHQEDRSKLLIGGYVGQGTSRFESSIHPFSQRRVLTFVYCSFSSLELLIGVAIAAPTSNNLDCISTILIRSVNRGNGGTLLTHFSSRPLPETKQCSLAIPREAFNSSTLPKAWKNRSVLGRRSPLYN
jgi:hypothetical protein